MDDPKAYRLAAIDSLGLPITDEIRKRAAKKDLNDFRPGQQVLFALLVHTFGELRDLQAKWWMMMVRVPFIVVGSGITSYWVLAIIGTVINWLAGHVGTWLLWSYYCLPLVLGGLLGYLIKHTFEESDIQFEYTGRNQLNSSLDLGRLSNALHPSSWGAMIWLFGMTAGVQVFMLHYLPGRLGLDYDGELNTCIMITVDNICHGVFFDAFELYGITVGQELKHNFVSASVFFLFRAAFDAYVVVTVVGLTRRYMIKSLFKKYPRGEPSVARLTDWLGTVCEGDHSWPRRFFDEFMFLALCRHYLMEDIPFIRKMSGQFPRLQIRANVRSLFTDYQGNLILAYMEDDIMANPDNLPSNRWDETES